MKTQELRQIIREEISKVLKEQNNPTISKIEKGRDTGFAFGAIGAGYKITLSDGTVIESYDEELLERYKKLRTGGRKSIEELNKILKGVEWDLNFDT